MPISASQAAPYGVFVVEDDERMREKVQAHVRSCAQLELLGSAASQAQALDWARTTVRAPRVLLTDLGLPDGSGIAVIEQFVRRFVGCEALVLSMFGDEEHVLASIAAGALGYIQKDVQPDDMARTVLALIAGESPISPGIARRLLSRLREAPPTGAQPGSARQAGANGAALTAIEVEVLDFLARGFSYREIAGLRGVKENTIASQVKSLYRKLNVRSRGEAVFEGLQNGILSPPH